MQAGWSCYLRILYGTQINLGGQEDIFIIHRIIIIKSEVSTFPIAVIFVGANYKVHYDPIIVLVCLHITPPNHHLYADLSESIELLKRLSGTLCIECVSKIKSVLFIIFHAIYGAVRIQLTHFYFDDCENTLTLFHYHHQIGSMTHLPLFRGRSRNNGLRCMSFCIPTKGYKQ